MNRLFRLTIRQLRTTYDLKPALFLSMILPSLFYIAVAAVAYSSIIAPFRLGDKTIDYGTFMIPGVVVVQVASTSMLGGMMYWTDKYNGMLERILALPFPRSYYFLSRLFSLLISNLSIALGLFLLGLPIMSSKLSLNAESIVIASLSIVSVCFFFGSLSLIASPFLKTADSVTVFSRIVSTPLFLISSAFYPLEYAPQVIRMVGWLNPMTYSVDILRSSVLGLSSQTLLYEGLALLTVTAFVFSLTIYAFEKREMYTT